MDSENSMNSFERVRYDGCKLIAAICLGSDGSEGFGCPMKATARREKAASEGALEAIIGLVQDLGGEDTKGTPAVLRAALRVCRAPGAQPTDRL